MTNFERAGLEKKAEGLENVTEQKKETGIESPEDIQAQIDANKKRIEALKTTESSTSSELKKAEAELGIAPETDIPSERNSEEEIAAIEQENLVLEQQKKVAEALNDPEKRARFEQMVSQMGSLSPEALEHAKETGEMHNQAEASEKGIDFQLKFSASNEAVKHIAGIYTEGFKTVGEIVKKIPPEALLALLA